MTTVTIEPRLSPGEAEALLRRQGFSFEDVQHAHWLARGPGCTVVFYKSGKMVVQGKACTEVAGLLGWDPAKGGGFEPGLAKHGRSVDSWIGMDESGKGDYFGPLVVAAVRVCMKDIAWLEELGIRDSKSLKDYKIAGLARLLERALPNKVVAIGPERYNSMYESMGNANKILAWAHKKALESLLEEAPVRLAVLDRFLAGNYMDRIVAGIGKDLVLDQRHKAEDDPAVAAASILARARFVKVLERLGSKYRVDLPKGAGPKVLQAATKLVAGYGADVLQKTAKVHFKTTRRILGD